MDWSLTILAIDIMFWLNFALSRDTARFWGCRLWHKDLVCLPMPTMTLRLLLWGQCMDFQFKTIMQVQNYLEQAIDLLYEWPKSSRNSIVMAIVFSNFAMLSTRVVGVSQLIVCWIVWLQSMHWEKATFFSVVSWHILQWCPSKILKHRTKLQATRGLIMAMNNLKHKLIGNITSNNSCRICKLSYILAEDTFDCRRTCSQIQLIWGKTRRRREAIALSYLEFYFLFLDLQSLWSH